MKTRLLVFPAIAALAITFAFAQISSAQPPAGPASQQDGPSNQADDDPPERAARLSYLNGNVSFQPGGVEDWVPATLNRPLTTGDRIWTEAGARAEVNLGSAALRLNGRTNFTFLNLRDNATQVQLSVGTISVRIRRLDDQESFEIDTPNVAFTALRPGEYRIDVNEQGDATIVTVRGGQGEASAGGQVFPVRPREQVRVTGNGDAPPTFDERDAPVADNFDNFGMERDRREDRSESVRHVSRDIPGYTDLDENGVWNEEPQYGWIWTPRVAVGWAPYHDGHWAWIAPWGWTWVDDARWGYAPFHYGRWAFVRGVWVWVPGPPAQRAVYAPALVAWVGGPRFNAGLSVGIGVGIGVGAVAWFALAPGEVWVPAYHASPRYFNQVNVSNTVVNRNVNITNVYNNVYVNRNTTTITNVTYANRTVNGAVVAVPHDVMVSGRPVGRAGVAVSREAMANAQIERAAPAVPQRDAVLGGRTPVNAVPPSAIANRTVVARRTPPSAPVPFAQQQAALQANPGQPVNNRALDQMQRERGSQRDSVQTGMQQRPQFRQAMPTPAAGQTPGQNIPVPSGQNSNRPAGPAGLGNASGTQNGSPANNNSPNNNPRTNENTRRRTDQFDRPGASQGGPLPIQQTPRPAVNPAPANTTQANPAPVNTAPRTDRQSEPRNRPENRNAPVDHPIQPAATSQAPHANQPPRVNPETSRPAPQHREERRDVKKEHHDDKQKEHHDEK